MVGSYQSEILTAPLKGGNIISCPSVVDFGSCPNTSGFCEGTTNVREVCDDISMPPMTPILVAGTLGR